MNHRQTLIAYESALNVRKMDDILDFIEDNAIFIFTEGTFRGKKEIKLAISKTFDLIKEESFSINNQTWIVENEKTAVCTYEFFWTGVINEKPTSGSGRGTTVLCKSSTSWKIILEHLGQPPRGN
jgi:ketosteroid isomerase-like protein